jgi:hypothetical protein
VLPVLLIDAELMQWIEDFGRWNVQEFVAKRQDVRDVITYLRAERSLELHKVTAFVTSDSVRFEKEEASDLSLRSLNNVQKMD